jgi:hypothetical protein
MAARADSRPPPPRRSFGVAAAGTLIEWYDFGLYRYLAPIYARVFFSGTNHVEALIGTLGILAVAYLARPVGARAWRSATTSRPRSSAASRRGGLAPLLGTALYHWTGIEEAPAFLVVAVVLASVLVIVCMRETAGVPLEDLG